MIEVGTRKRMNFLQGVRAPQGSQTRTFTKDLGMSKYVSASVTFVNSTTAQLQAANGTFAAFAVGDMILVEGTNQNNGYHTVTAIDGTNQSYLTVSPPPKNEGPLTAVVRTS